MASFWLLRLEGNPNTFEMVDYSVFYRQHDPGRLSNYRKAILMAAQAISNRKGENIESLSRVICEKDATEKDAIVLEHIYVNGICVKKLK